MFFKQLLSNRFFHAILLVALLVAVLFVRNQDYSWVQSLRYNAFDQYNALYPRQSNNVAVIVDIDEASQARPELGQWPWSRDKLAVLVRNLEAAGAKVVAFDMVFAEEDRTSPRKVGAALGLEDKAATLPDWDESFAEAIRQSGNVVTGFVWSNDENATRRALKLVKPVLLGKDAKGLGETIPAVRHVTTNLPLFSEAAAGNGNFGVQSEVDGIIRRVPLLFSDQTRFADTGAQSLIPSLAMEALRVAQDPRQYLKVSRIEAPGAFEATYKIQNGAFEIPFDRDGRIYVWFSRRDPARYVSAWNIISGDFDASKIRDKIVFVGTSAEGLRDIRSTPLDLFIPGVELHANIVEQVSQQAFLQRPQVIDTAEILFLFLGGVAIILLAQYFGAFVMMMVMAGGLLCIFGMSLYAYRIHGFLIDPVYPSLTLFLIFTATSVLTYLRTEAERRQVRDAFGMYISPAYLKKLSRHPDQLTLGGEIRPLTVLFSDIRNFTSISEGMTPERLIATMNDFLTPLSECVLERQGTIDKYIGDAMMAFWNAPIDDPDHARHACQAALKMVSLIDPINERLQKEALEEGRKPFPLKIGIGLHTGPCAVGNMGSKQRFAYSALGDAVNLASRLEGQTKFYGVPVLISEDTKSHVEDMATLELDYLRVKGRQQPVRLYALLGDADVKASEDFSTLWIAHNKMLKAYFDGNFDEAAAYLKDGPYTRFESLKPYAEMFKARLKSLQKKPPQDWDGVFDALSK